ncbi:MAG: hypothetical protein SGCHY_003772 [Lobulomycetales sp.]
MSQITPPSPLFSHPVTKPKTRPLDVPNSLSALEWSPDSRLVAVASFKLGTVQVFHTETEWTARIDEGLAGLTRIRFAPLLASSLSPQDSPAESHIHLLTYSDYNLRITVWDLGTGTIDTSDGYSGKEEAGRACYLQFPKHATSGQDFRSDGLYFALLERRDGKDAISVFDTAANPVSVLDKRMEDTVDSWMLVKHFELEHQQNQTFSDACDCAWSPCGRFLAVWESSLDYKVGIYYPDGRLVHTHAPSTPTTAGLGIRRVSWSPSSQFLALGGYDQVVRCLNNHTWSVVLEFSHLMDVDSRVVWEEHDGTQFYADDGKQDFEHGSVVFRRPASYARSSIDGTAGKGSLWLPASTRPNPDKPNPKLGVGLMAFSPTGRYLATRNDPRPGFVFHCGPDDSLGSVGLADADTRVCFYDVTHGHVQEPPRAVDLPDGMRVSRLEWRADGEALLCLDRDKMVVWWS